MAKDVIDYFSEESTIFGFKMHCDFSGESLQVDIIKRIITNNFKPFAPYGGTMVDLGCGFGHEIKYLAEEFSLRKVFAIDGSKTMIDAMDKSTFGVDVCTQVANLLKDKTCVPSEVADIVVSTCTVPYLKDLKNFFSESSRVLKRKGILAFDIIIHFENQNEIIPVYSDHTEVYSYFYAFENILFLAKRSGLSLLGQTEMPCRAKGPKAEHLMMFFLKN